MSADRLVLDPGTIDTCFTDHCEWVTVSDAVVVRLATASPPNSMR
jgi:hypothetical protein